LVDNGNCENVASFSFLIQKLFHTCDNNGLETDELKQHGARDLALIGKWQSRASNKNGDNTEVSKS